VACSVLHAAAAAAAQQRSALYRKYCSTTSPLECSLLIISHHCRAQDAGLPLAKLCAAYQQLLVIVRKLYQECRLVHADLSEYNILVHKVSGNWLLLLLLLLLRPVSQQCGMRWMSVLLFFFSITCFLCLRRQQQQEAEGSSSRRQRPRAHAIGTV